MKSFAEFKLSLKENQPPGRAIAFITVPVVGREGELGAGARGRAGRGRRGRSLGPRLPAPQRRRPLERRLLVFPCRKTQMHAVVGTRVGTDC
jgi:hypothetical protein